MTTNIMQYPEWEIEQGHEVKTKKKHKNKNMNRDYEHE